METITARSPYTQNAREEVDKVKAEKEAERNNMLGMTLGGA
jgi:predicted esterase YcpF (UPF0227 family)